MKRFTFCCIFILISFLSFAQPGRGVMWSTDGESYYFTNNDVIEKVNLRTSEQKKLVGSSLLTPVGANNPLKIKNFFVSDYENKILIYTNSKRVWRYETRGDYWLLDLQKNSLHQLGKSLPASSLMFAKISPDGTKAAYVSKHNLYVEDLATKKITQLTTNGTDRIINGTFDWVYEEEFGTRDGFRWSPDSKRIAYWNVDASAIRNFLMINNTDSIYSYNIPVEYPKVGYPPSPVKIGTIDINTKKTIWAKVPGDPSNNYLPRMEWASNNEIVIQQLNRKQNESNLYVINTISGTAKNFYQEKNKAWIDIKSRWHDDNPVGWDWIENKNSFLWMSEKDGWRHLYKVDKNGNEKLITKGNYDVIDLLAVNEKEGYIYFLASPDNATQQYLFRTKIDGSSSPQKLSPTGETGTHEYDISPSGKYALHAFSNVNTFPYSEWISVATHSTLGEKQKIQKQSGDYPKVRDIFL